MAALHLRDWKDISREASMEADPERLMSLIDELNAALEQREREQKQNHSVANNSRHSN